MQTIEILDELIEEGSEKMDVRNKDEVISRIKSAVASKQFGQEDILCPLIADVIFLSSRLLPIPSVLFIDFWYIYSL